MRLLLSAAMLLSLGMAGCSSQSSSADTNGQKPEAERTDAQNPVKAKGTAVPLSPENAKIQFVGKHTDESKDDRIGTFSKFAGEAKVDEGKLASIQFDIETSSVFAHNEKLTNHLKTADFLDVREYPKATFQSTKVEPAGEGKVNITGDFTLLKTTKSITIPATVSTEDGLSLKSDFTIDRTQWGMNYGTAGVEKEVDLTVTIGK